MRVVTREKLRDLHFLPNILRVIKSKGMRWAGFFAPVERQGKCKVWRRHLKNRIYLEE